MASTTSSPSSTQSAPLMALTATSDSKPLPGDMSTDALEASMNKLRQYPVAPLSVSGAMSMLPTGPMSAGADVALPAAPDVRVITTESHHYAQMYHTGHHLSAQPATSALSDPAPPFELRKHDDLDRLERGQSRGQSMLAPRFHSNILFAGPGAVSSSFRSAGSTHTASDHRHQSVHDHSHGTSSGSGQGYGKAGSSLQPPSGGTQVARPSAAHSMISHPQTSQTSAMSFGRSAPLPYIHSRSHFPRAQPDPHQPALPHPMANSASFQHSTTANSYHSFDQPLLHAFSTQQSTFDAPAHALQRGAIASAVSTDGLVSNNKPQRATALTHPDHLTPPSSSRTPTDSSDGAVVLEFGAGTGYVPSSSPTSHRTTHPGSISSLSKVPDSVVPFSSSAPSTRSIPPRGPSAHRPLPSPDHGQYIQISPSPVPGPSHASADGYCDRLNDRHHMSPSSQQTLSAPHQARHLQQNAAYQDSPAPTTMLRAYWNPPGGMPGDTSAPHRENMIDRRPSVLPTPATSSHSSPPYEDSVAPVAPRMEQTRQSMEQTPPVHTNHMHAHSMRSGHYYQEGPEGVSSAWHTTVAPPPQMASSWGPATHPHADGAVAWGPHEAWQASRGQIAPSYPMDPVAHPAMLRRPPSSVYYSPPHPYHPPRVAYATVIDAEYGASRGSGGVGAGPHRFHHHHPMHHPHPMMPSHRMVEPATVDSLTSPYASAANLDAYGQRIKRPPNSFLLFSQKRRRELLLDDRHATTAHLSKILGREWTDMTPEQKAPYVMMANEQRESFQQRYPNYVLSRRPNRRVRNCPVTSGPAPVSISTTAHVLDARAHAPASASPHTYAPRGYIPYARPESTLGPYSAPSTSGSRGSPAISPHVHSASTVYARPHQHVRTYNHPPVPSGLAMYHSERVTGPDHDPHRWTSPSATSGSSPGYAPPRLGDAPLSAPAAMPTSHELPHAPVSNAPQGYRPPSGPPVDLKHGQTTSPVTTNRDALHYAYYSKSESNDHGGSIHASGAIDHRSGTDVPAPASVMAHPSREMTPSQSPRDGGSGSSVASYHPNVLPCGSSRHASPNLMSPYNPGHPHANDYDRSQSQSQPQSHAQVQVKAYAQPHGHTLASVSKSLDVLGSTELPANGMRSEGSFMVSSSASDVASSHSSSTARRSGTPSSAYHDGHPGASMA